MASVIGRLEFSEAGVSFGEAVVSLREPGMSLRDAGIVKRTWFGFGPLCSSYSDVPNLTHT